jgi:hypothetical protein
MAHKKNISTSGNSIYAMRGASREISQDVGKGPLYEMLHYAGPQVRTGMFEL